jgi:hypothetical protein
VLRNGSRSVLSLITLSSSQSRNAWLSTMENLSSDLPVRLIIYLA